MNSHLDVGTVQISHKGKLVNTVVGNSNWDNLVANIETVYEYDIGSIPEMFAHRPDNISNVFYNSPSTWWLLQLANGVIDPFEEFNPNDRILIPKV